MGPHSPAELIHRVRFERRTPVDDGYGNKRGGWATLIEFRSALLTPTRPRAAAASNEPVIAARQQGIAIWDLWVRYDSATLGVTTDDRVVDARDASRTFNIKFKADMDGRKTWLLMQLEQGTADG